MSLTASQSVIALRVPSTPTGPAIVPDYTVVMLLSAMRRLPQVLQVVRRLGRALFPKGAAQTLAISIVTGTPISSRHLGHSELEHLSVLNAELQRCELPHTLEWGLSLVRWQAERRHKHLLADMLRWCADEVMLDHPLEHLQKLLHHAFDIAKGDAPLDPTCVWEPEP